MERLVCRCGECAHNAAAGCLAVHVTMKKDRGRVTCASFMKTAPGVDLREEYAEEFVPGAQPERPMRVDCPEYACAYNDAGRCAAEVLEVSPSPRRPRCDSVFDVSSFV